MMDEIIYLEPDEEITSVIDKMKQTKGRLLGFVVPRDATILQSVVNLRLLQKEANNLEKEISIITTDKIGRNLASQVGLNVYNSIKEEKPTYMPTPPVADPDEVIEIDMSGKHSEKKPDGVNVHHFQEEPKPILWKKHHAPVFNPQPEKVEEKIEKDLSEPKPMTKTMPARPVKHLDPLFKKILWPIVVVIVLLIGAAGYLVLPKADVKVFVLAETLQKSLPIVISGKITKPITEDKVFPGKLIEANKEQTQKFPATGKKNLGGKASGTITITNNFDSTNHALAIGTKVANSSKTFLTKKAVTVPGATLQNGGIVPGSVKVDIEAENPGSDYNIKAGSFTILGLPSNQQKLITAASTADLAGGFTKEVQVVSQTDYDAAKKQLLDKMTEDLDKELKTQAKTLKVLDKAVVFPDPEIVAMPKVDEEATEFELKIKSKKQILAFDFGEFKDFLLKLLEKEAPSDKMVTIPSDDNIGFVVNLATYDKEELNLAANIEAKISSRISAEKIKSQIIGKSATDVINFINGQDGVSKTEIKFWPDFWHKMPDLAQNITVSIEYINK